MSQVIPPNRKALAEALSLSDEILRNIELSELPLTNIALKTARLARLLNDFDTQKIMGFEVGGYTSNPDGVPLDVYNLAVAAGREFQSKSLRGKVSTVVYTNSIGELEEELRLAEAALIAAKDPDVTISSANPNQFVSNPAGNTAERAMAKGTAAHASKRLASSRAFIHEYVVRKHYELKFSGIADDIFNRIRERVDAAIGAIIPDAVKRFSAVYDNLQSENPEDWSNAVHSCRRVLQDLADALFPPRSEDRVVIANGKELSVRLGAQNYINRIIAFVEDSNSSERYEHLVGSHIRFLGERLDSIFKAAQKGSHETIVSREEADRYVTYTYLIVGDILSLRKKN
jgi:hypothetical protein